MGRATQFAPGGERMGIPDAIAIVHFGVIAYLAVKLGQWLRGDLKR